MGRNMAREAFADGNCFANGVVTNQIGLLLQHGLRPLSIMDDRHIAAIDIGWARYRNSHHAKLIM